jgi:hypothetical protein
MRIIENYIHNHIVWFKFLHNYNETKNKSEGYPATFLFIEIPASRRSAFGNHLTSRGKNFFLNNRGGN